MKEIKSKLSLGFLVFPLLSISLLVAALQLKNPIIKVNNQSLKQHKILIAIDTSKTMQAKNELGTYYAQANQLAASLITKLPNTSFGLIYFNQYVRPISIQTTDIAYLLQKLSEPFDFSNERKSKIQHVFDYANLYFNSLSKGKRWIVILTNGHLTIPPDLNTKLRLFQLSPIFVSVSQKDAALLTLKENTQSYSLETIKPQAHTLKNIANNKYSHFIDLKPNQDLNNTLMQILTRSQQSYASKPFQKTISALLLMSFFCYLLWIIFAYKCFPKILLISSLIFFTYHSELFAVEMNVFQASEPDYVTLKIEIPIEPQQNLAKIDASFINKYVKVHSFQNFLSIHEDAGDISASHVVIFKVLKPNLRNEIWIPSRALSLGKKTLTIPALNAKISSITEKNEFPKQENLDLPYYFYFNAKKNPGPYYDLEYLDINFFFLKRSAKWSQLYVDLDPLWHHGDLRFCPQKSFQKQYSLIYYKVSVLCLSSSTLTELDPLKAWLKNSAEEHYISQSSALNFIRQPLPQTPPIHFSKINTPTTLSVSAETNFLKDSFFSIVVKAIGKSAKSLDSVNILKQSDLELFLVEKLLVSDQEKHFIYAAKALKSTSDLPTFYIDILNKNTESFERIYSDTAEKSLIPNSQAEDERPTSRQLKSSVYFSKLPTLFYSSSLIVLLSLICFLIVQIKKKNHVK